MTRRCSRSPVRRAIYHSYSSMYADCCNDCHADIGHCDDDLIADATNDLFCTTFLGVFCLLGMVQWLGIVVEINSYLRVLGIILMLRVVPDGRSTKILVASIAALCLHQQSILVWSTGLISTLAVLKGQ